jgi:hypothetical protein
MKRMKCQKSRSAEPIVHLSYIEALRYGVVIAALTGLGSFYHWDRTSQKNATGQASIEAFLVKWELELAHAKEFVASPDQTKHEYDATDD